MYSHDDEQVRKISETSVMGRAIPNRHMSRKSIFGELRTKMGRPKEGEYDSERDSRILKYQQRAELSANGNCKLCLFTGAVLERGVHFGIEIQEE